MDVSELDSHDEDFVGLLSELDEAGLVVSIIGEFFDVADGSINSVDDFSVSGLPSNVGVVFLVPDGFAVSKFGSLVVDLLFSDFKILDGSAPLAIALVEGVCGFLPGSSGFFDFLLSERVFA